MNDYSITQFRSVLIAVAILLVLAIVPFASAQTGIDVYMRDTAGYPGQTIFMPVMINNYLDTLEAFRFNYIMDRPNMAAYTLSTPEFDTTVVCVDPPWCTVQDTIVDTFPRVLFDSAGTLVSGWDYVGGGNLGFETHVRMIGFSNTDANSLPVGISPLTFGGHLLSLAVTINCHPDPFGGGEVQIVESLLGSEFANEQGQLLSPVNMTGALVTVLDPVPGDQDFSGFVDSVDLSKMVDCVFYGQCPLCDAVQTDYNCDGQPDSVDLSLLIDFIFLGGDPLTPCP